MLGTNFSEDNFLKLTEKVDHDILLCVSPVIGKYNGVSPRAASVRLLQLEGEVFAVHLQVVVGPGDLGPLLVEDLGSELPARHGVEN